jgi:hypothetical protein
MENESPVAVAEAPAVAPPPFEGDDAQPAAPKTTDSGKSKDELTEARRRISELERNNQELSASERYWHGQVKGEPAEDDDGEAAGDPPPDPEGEAPTTEAFLDELNEKGPEAVAKELVRRGFVRKEDVAKVAEQVARQIVTAERGKQTIDAQIASEFPELKDDKSELFQETARIFRTNIALDPSLKKSPAALMMAARQARAEIKAKTPQRREPDDYREREGADAQRRRIDAQRGDLGRGGGTPFEDDDDNLGPEHREVLEMFRKSGLTEKDYREQRAKNGRRR